MVAHQTTKELLAESLKELSQFKSVDKITIKELTKKFFSLHHERLRDKSFGGVDKNSAQSQRIIAGNFFLCKIFYAGSFGICKRLGFGKMGLFAARNGKIFY